MPNAYKAQSGEVACLRSQSTQLGVARNVPPPKRAFEHPVLSVGDQGPHTPPSLAPSPALLPTYSVCQLGASWTSTVVVLRDLEGLVQQLRLYGSLVTQGHGLERQALLFFLIIYFYFICIAVLTACMSV